MRLLSIILPYTNDEDFIEFQINNVNMTNFDYIIIKIPQTNKKKYCHAVV